MNPPKQTQQAGGGTSPSAQPSHNAIESFEANVLTSLREIFQESERPKSTDFPTYLKQMCSPESNAMLPLPSANLNLPLSSYFISSSHNTYLTGHQLYGSANIDGYKNVSLLLQFLWKYVVLRLRYSCVAVDVSKSTAGMVDQTPKLTQNLFKKRMKGTAPSNLWFYMVWTPWFDMTGSRMASITCR